MQRKISDKVSMEKQILTEVTIKSTARLHMGFFDLHGGLGRKFGSIGLALKHPATTISMKKSKVIEVDGMESARANNILRNLQHALGLSAKQSATIQIKEAIPAHAGLGSGTQLALAVGMAYSQLYELNLTPLQIAQITARGARSGIGVGTFLHGGVVVDGGRGANTVIPPIIAQADFPEDWRIILILDASHQGVHGEQEVNAFNHLSPAPKEVAENLCRHVLMQALPALAERDLPKFGEAVRALQMATGDYFAPAQGGRYASKKVANVLEYLNQIGVPCTGQSSWGPTGFAIVASEVVALAIVVRLEAMFASETALSFVVTGAATGKAK